MPTNNAWNAGTLASSAEALAGTSATQVISPSTLSAVQNLNRLQLPHFENLGMRYASSTFTVLGSDWSNLSSTNYAKISLPSNVSPGKIITYTITANQSFVDATGSSTIVGNTFGTTAGVAWSATMPFFLYCAASSSDTNPVFFVARMAGRHHLPPAASIGQSGSAIADADDAVFALSAITAANYAGSATMFMGSFVMSSKSASDDWTVSAFTDEDGMGMAKDDDWYDFPTGQMGAASGKYFWDNGGTAPTFGVNAYRYNVAHDGICRIAAGFTNTSGNTAGAGAVTARLALPFKAQYSTYTSSLLYTNGATTNIAIWSTTASQSYAEMYREGSGALIQNSNLNNNSRAINGSMNYRTLEG